MREYKIEAIVHICEMTELSEEDRQLVEAAKQATDSSYAPYSKFRVGAAVRLKDGTVVAGANQENAAYPSGLCAERTALFAAGAQHPSNLLWLWRLRLARVASSSLIPFRLAEPADKSYRA